MYCVVLRCVRLCITRCVLCYRAVCAIVLLRAFVFAIRNSPYKRAVSWWQVVAPTDEKLIQLIIIRQVQDRSSRYVIRRTRW